MTIRVESPGLLTTVQDLGRAGYQRLAISVGGAMDGVALRIANALVGNDEGAAALELTLRGPTLTFVEPALLAVAGGDLAPTLDGEALPSHRACAAPAGATLAFGGARSGCRAYLAVAGGIDVPPVLGSRSTDLRAGIGGTRGHAVTRGDVLATGAASPDAARSLERMLGAGRRCASWGVAPAVDVSRLAEPVIRILPGPEHDRLTHESRTALVESPFRIGSRSDRMGFRLEGVRLELDRRDEMVSSPVSLGTVQLPPDGEPIALMADRQTIGGYPRIAQVATADLPVLAQLAPSAGLRFRMITLAEARRLQDVQRRELSSLTAGIRHHHR